MSWLENSNKRVSQWLLAVVALLSLSACSTAIEEYQGEQPKLQLEEFFKGDLVAHGVVQDYSDKVIQRFTVQMQGRWDGNQGTLDEQFSPTRTVVHRNVFGSSQKRVPIPTRGEHRMLKVSLLVPQRVMHLTGNTCYRLKSMAK